MYFQTSRQKVTRCVYTLRHVLIAPSHLTASLECRTSCITVRAQLFGSSALQTQTCANTNITSCQNTNNKAGNRTVITRGISPRYGPSQLSAFTHPI